MYKVSLMKNLIFEENYISKSLRVQFVDYLEGLTPLWENRFSESNPPPKGDQQRKLLRPVYWLGNWQFACLNYYHPPRGIDYRCVEAEPFPDFMQRVVDDVENKVRNEFSPSDIPHKWHLNTCLVNYYGTEVRDNQTIDLARVGEHKDFEPGPVASISFGDRALFQFVESSGRDRAQKSKVILQQWLSDSCLQVFGGEKFKKKLFHRVQRVEEKSGKPFQVKVENFITRRINLTFRYVPTEHIKPYRLFPENLQRDVHEYMLKLSEKSSFFQEQIKL
ncbi:MAG: alpha-ketoglutarate-dependent dioxygenase AlkB [Bdellovibrionaceae bacterium]|nr:alpha-ketoglutarate-dependent dioxygenase AlkB [Pseudobdellovibrionaceae bacterium]